MKSITYRDKWGELWERINTYYVRRVSDGNIGGWYEGRGLWILSH